MNASEADDLSSFAFMDARHDFGPEVCAHYFSILQESLPGGIYWIPDEDSALRLAPVLSNNSLQPILQMHPMYNSAAHVIHQLLFCATRPSVLHL